MFSFRPSELPQAKATPAEQLGIVPRAVVALFDRVEAIKAEKDVAAPATSAPESFAPATSASSFSSTSSCVVRLSFLQIYNEKIFDLLNPSSTVSQREAGGRGEEFSGLRLRWDAARRHFFVENLFQYECSSAEEALQHYQQGIQNKQAHRANSKLSVKYLWNKALVWTIWENQETST